MDQYSCFNNGDGAELIEPSALTSTSSEGGYDEDSPSAYLASSFGDTASATTYDLTQQQNNELMALESLGGQAEAPQKYGDDLAYINPRDLPFDLGNIPDRLLELDNGAISGQHPRDVLESSSRSDNNLLLGIPSHESVPQRHPLGGTVHQTFDTCNALLSNQIYPQELVVQVLENLAIIRDFFQSRLPTSPATVDESSSSACGQYLCQLCGDIFDSFGTVKRHLHLHGFWQYDYYCRRDNRHAIRRDRMGDHLNRVHGIHRPNVEHEARRVGRAHPTSCPCCRQRTGSWKEFFDHIRRHFLVHSGSRNNHVRSPRSRGNDDGGDDVDNNGSGYEPFPTESIEYTGQPQLNAGYQPQNRPNGHNGNSMHSGSRGLSGNINAQGGTTSHSASSSRSRARRPRRPNRQPRRSRPPRNPGSSNPARSDQKKSRKQKAPIEGDEPNSGICKCGHKMSNCGQCSTVKGCHNCGPASSGSIVQARPSAQTPGRAYQDPGLTSFDFGSAFLTRLGVPGPSDYRPLQQFYNPPGGSMQQFGMPTPNQYLGTMPNTSINNSSAIRDPNIVMASVTESHAVLGDLGHKSQGSPFLETDTKLLQNVGLGSLIGLSRIKVQTKQAEPLTAGGPFPTSYTDLVLRSKAGSNTAKFPQLVTQCQCPCVTMPIKKKEACDGFQVSPNERVELTVNISPARETSHPLRTCVRVVVRLLRLHSSVAQSTAQKQWSRSTTPEFLLKDDAGYDTDSDEDLPLTSPSGPGFKSMFYWTEEVQDWFFSFDLEWVLLNFAQFTSGSDADTCQKLKLPDSGQILKVIMKKIIWWFMENRGLGLLLSI